MSQTQPSAVSTIVATSDALFPDTTTINTTGSLSSSGVSISGATFLNVTGSLVTDPSTLSPANITVSGTTLDIVTGTLTSSGNTIISSGTTASIGFDPVEIAKKYVNELETDVSQFAHTAGSYLETKVEELLGSGIKNVEQRALADVAGDYEVALKDLESFAAAKEKFIENYIADELAALKAKAEANFITTFLNKKTIFTTLETELATVGKSLSTRFHQTIGSL